MLETYFESLFRDLVRQINEKIDAKFAEFIEHPKSVNKESHELKSANKKRIDSDIIDVKEAAELTRLSIGSLYRKTHLHEIPYYKKGTGKSCKLYFRKSELEDWMTECRVSTAAEINSEAALHIAQTR